ncbi:MAG: hypothetical protein A2270_01125 [Elusimicrobia bacterium RIFOXYA12_FULL_51_18]|nr:MAG: hypothetical protein A2270_01125 [Elusimicrobia bacterium RIFOXYA12_FULL_51_18]OGS31095.1 MAG: hypothetical protein A2218_02010 [Elusimicrobia bacterium RIFOXYA2_FULL_53_38]
MNNILSDIIRAVTNTDKVNRLESEIFQIRTILTDQRKERSERRKDLLVNFVVALSSGALIALFTIWLTNTANKKNLDSLIDVNFGMQDSFGRILVSTGTVKIYIENIGPNDVQDIRLNLITFHANILAFDKIELDVWPLKPLHIIKKLKVGEKYTLDLKEAGFNWEAAFQKDENPKLNAHRPKESQLFCRLSAKYSRSWDNKPFYVNSIYKMYRNILLPWNLPMSNDKFIPDNRL